MGKRSNREAGDDARKETEGKEGSRKERERGEEGREKGKGGGRKERITRKLSCSVPWIPCNVAPFGPIIIPIFLLSTVMSLLTASTGPLTSDVVASDAAATGAAFAFTYGRIAAVTEEWSVLYRSGI
jgi:hypothetical protein